MPGRIGMTSRPARLALFVPSMRGGGAEQVMLSLARGVADRGYAVDLVLAQAEGPYLAAVPDDVRLVDLRASRVLLSLQPLINYLRRERPTALLSAMKHANIVALWARRLAGVPTRVVISEHNTLSESLRHKSSPRRGRVMLGLMRRFYPWADAIVPVSDGVADDLVCRTGLRRERITTIYNPVMRPELRQKMQARVDHPWFAPGEPPVILAVGRLSPQKDFPTLIRAFAEVLRAVHARLLILGQGSERPLLEALVTELGLQRDVSLPGFVENPYAYMAQASLFVLSSRFEGLPLVLIEALCCGARVVAADCESGPREILLDGQYGRLVPVGSVPGLAQAIRHALANGASAPPPESWRRFEIRTVVNQYLGILLDRQ